MHESKNYILLALSFYNYYSLIMKVVLTIPSAIGSGLESFLLYLALLLSITSYF